MSSVRAAIVTAAFFVGTHAFAPAPSCGGAASRASSARFAAKTDFIKPLEGRQVNFGDDLNSYWGAAAFLETFGEPVPMNDGVYEVILRRPLGLVFEEVVPDLPKGVRVCEVLEGGNAANCGTPIGVGDELVAATGVKIQGAKWERQLVGTQTLDFDTIMSCIGSNEEKWGCTDVVLHLKRAADTSA